MNERDAIQLEEEIFAQASVMRCRVQRAEYLDDVCGTDTDLRVRLDCLLAEFDQPKGIFEAPDRATDSVARTAAYPTRFGDFEIVREIGRGGMGIVYEARQESLNRKVALKVLSVGLCLTKKAIARFQREAEAAARLHHTNIVPIYSTGLQNQIPYYAMELVQGPSLDQILKELRDASVSSVEQDRHAHACASGQSQRQTIAISGSATLNFNSSSGTDKAYFARVASLIADVADALHHAHGEGIIHRDVKPSNLLLLPDGRLSLNDFGLARMLTTPGVTMTGELLGSPRYMSPEQVSPDYGELDHRTDIYSLGATLYELLTLRAAFEGDQPEKLLAQVLHHEPKAPRKIDAKIPIDLETICAKAMEKKPDQRYPTAAAMAEDLRRFVSCHAICARRIGPVGRAIRWCRRNRAVASLSAIVVVLCLVGACLIASQRMTRARDFQTKLAAIDRLLQEQQTWDARIRIQDSLQEFPERRETLVDLQNRFGRRIEILSQPPGAEILVRPAADNMGRWLALGKAPISTRLPKTHYLVRASLPGREALICQQSANPGSPATWTLALSTRPGMVVIPSPWYVDGSDACRITWLLSRQLPRIDAFHIDRHEVTNGEYKEFVEAQGYHQRQWWCDTLGDSWEQVVSNFTTSDERIRGPRLWPGDTYPQGMKDHPVVGVSWYEAMAYAKWAGKQLPTLFHWLRGADFNGWYYDPNLRKRNNIGNILASPRAADRELMNVDQYGVFDTQGNVKEWCLNEEHDGKFYAMGGSWRDAVDITFEPVAFSALDRRDDTGFRCASYAARPDLTTALPVQWRSIPPRRDIEPYRETFVHERPNAPWNASKPEQVQFNGVTATKVHFDATYGENERITCYIVLPDRERFAAPFQVVLGTGWILRGEDGMPHLQLGYMDYYSRMRQAGRAIVFATLYGTSYDRPGFGFLSEYPDPKRLSDYREWVAKMAKDVSRTADFIQNYASITGGENLLDGNNLALCACGTMHGACWLVADERFLHGKQRFKAVIFGNSGLVNCAQPIDVDQLTYVPWLKTPALMLGSMRRLDMPYAKSQQPMFDLIPLAQDTTKKLFVDPNALWGLPMDDVDREISTWLNKFLAEPEPSRLVKEGRPERVTPF